MRLIITRCFVALSVLLSCIAISLPQSGSTAQAPAQQNNSSKPVRTQDTFRTTTRLVVLDVVVTDDKGNQVKDLKAEDFTVSEDGAPQEVIDFSFHAPSSIAPIASQQNVISNVPQYQGQSCLNIILLDAINTDFSSHAYAQDMLVKYLDSGPTIQPTAVYALEGNLKLLHDFTTDPKALREVLAHYKSLGPTHLPTVEAAASPFGHRGSFQPVAQGRTAAFYAMSSLAQGLRGYPGRKNLIWISEGFPLNLFPDAIMGDQALVIEDFSPVMEKIADDLMAAQVAVYPISAAGVSLNSQFGPYGAMAGLADRTGGKMFANRNDIDTGVRTSLDDGSTYYTLEYYPTNKKWDDKFRHIRVKVNRPGVKLQHRDGYYGSSPSARYAENVVAHQLSDAMSIYAPAATGLVFQAAVLPPSAATQNRMMVNFAIDPHALAFQRGADDLEHASLSCMVWAYAGKGDPVRAEGTSNAALNADEYRQVMQSYFPCRRALDLKPGRYTLRLGVLDLNSSLMGTATTQITVP
jgi:VWFA-related protein